MVTDKEAKLPEHYEASKIHFPNFTPRQVNLICEFSRYIDDMHGDGLVDQWTINMIDGAGSVGCHLHKFINMYREHSDGYVEHNNDVGFYLFLLELGIETEPQLTRLLHSCFEREIDPDQRNWVDAWDSRKWAEKYGETFFQACSAFAFRTRELYNEIGCFIENQKKLGANISRLPITRGIDYV